MRMRSLRDIDSIPMAMPACCSGHKRAEGRRQERGPLG
jgi:hypothetical protein